MAHQNAEDSVKTQTVPAEPKEKEYLFLKSFTCPICDKTFKSPVMKTGKVRRRETDLDLRPRFDDIDSNKYDIASCPKCGFTAMHRYYEHLVPVQRKLIKAGVIDKLKTPPAKEIKELQTFDYDTAIGLYKAAMEIADAKRAASSEKAYISLKTAWLLLGKMEDLVKDKKKNKAAIIACMKDYQSYYTQAFDGFVKAMASENYPMCGMDQHTMDFLIAAMAYNLGKYDYSSRFVSELLVSRTAGSNVKKRARELKEMIIEKMKDQK